MNKRLSAVHRYWFGSAQDDLEIIKEKGKLWFGKDPAVDQHIRAEFGDLVRMAAAPGIKADGLPFVQQLAIILLLDQFPRNIYRGDPGSFASDSLARKLAQHICRSGANDLRPIEKVFLYLPFEHSEQIDDQKKSVALYRQLHETVAEELKDAFAGFYDYAVRHHDIIARFGRFPHRNSVLNRASTAEELEFLSQPGSSF